jgi:hypothetical protein
MHQKNLLVNDQITEILFYRARNFGTGSTGQNLDVREFSPHFHIQNVSNIRFRFAQWLSLLVSGFPLQRPSFNPSPIHVGFVLDKEAREKFYMSTSFFSFQHKSKNVPCSFVYQRHHIISANGRIENCALLGYYAPLSGISLRKFRGNLSVPSLRVRDFWPLGITTTCYVITQKNALLIYFAAEAWNHATGSVV